MCVCMGCAGNCWGCAGSPCAWHKLPLRGCCLEARDESHGRYPNTQKIGELQIGMFGACYCNVGGTKHARWFVFLLLKMASTDFISFIQLQLRDIPKKDFPTQVCTLVVLIVYFLLVAFKTFPRKNWVQLSLILWEPLPCNFCPCVHWGETHRITLLRMKIRLGIVIYVLCIYFHAPTIHAFGC